MDALPEGFEVESAQPAPAPAAALPQGFEVESAPHQFGLGDTWPARLAKSLYGAVTLPGDVYQGKVAPLSDEAVGRAWDLATFASPLSPGKAPPIARPPTNEMLGAAADKDYSAALKAPIELKPDALRSFRDNIIPPLNLDGYNDVTAPITFKLLEKFDPPSGAVAVTPQNLRALQKSLNVIKNKNPDPTERLVAGSVVNHFNNFLENLDQVPSALAKGTPEDAAQFSQLVKRANGNYHAEKASEAFDFRGEVAENNAHAANSGMNLENNLRSQVRQILNNKSLQRGMSDDTLQAMKEFNNGSTSANVLRGVANAFGGGGGIGMLAAGSIGHFFGLPFESLPGIGLAMKAIANKRAANQFNAIGDTIRADSPLASEGILSFKPRSALTSRTPTLAAPMLSQPNSSPLAQPWMPVPKLPYLYQ